MVFDAHDAEFDEYRGGLRTELCSISFPKEGDVYKATREVWPWAKAGAHDPDRVTVPGIFVEALFSESVVSPPTSKALQVHGFLTKCLSEDHFVDALQKMIEEGLLHDPCNHMRP